MRWRNFKTDSSGIKAIKGIKPPAQETFMDSIPSIPSSENETEAITLEEFTAEFGNDPRAVKQFAMNLDELKIRRNGELPHGYIKAVECQQCGPVLLPAGLPTEVPACCWCLNRVAGLPIPRALSNVEEAGDNDTALVAHLPNPMRTRQNLT